MFKIWPSVSIASLSPIIALILALTSTEAGEVKKEYIFQNPFHQLLSQIFTRNGNDCADSFYPRVRNIR